MLLLNKLCYVAYLGSTIVLTLCALEEALVITESAVSGLCQHQNNKHNTYRNFMSLKYKINNNHVIDGMMLCNCRCSFSNFMNHSNSVNEHRL